MGAGEPGMLSPSPPTYGPLARAPKKTKKNRSARPPSFSPLVRLTIRATCEPVGPGRIRPEAFVPFVHACHAVTRGNEKK